MKEDAKNKAIELVCHFKGRGMDGDEKYASKECATIVVDEMISEYENEIIEANDMDRLGFWEEVKNQIKLI